MTGQAQVEAQVIHLLERYLTVEELLGLPGADREAPRAAPYPVNVDVAEAEHAAHGLRTHWGLGVDPIPNLVGFRFRNINAAGFEGCSGEPVTHRSPTAGRALRRASRAGWRRRGAFHES